MEKEKWIAFILRDIQNQIRLIIHRSAPGHDKGRGPKSQLQGGILGYLYRHGGVPVYQKDLEKEFRISRATATNTLQVMERDGLIVRKALDKDARLKRIQLTEEAHENHKRFEAHMELLNSRMLAGMSEAEVAELCRLLGLLQRNLEAWREELGDPPEEGMEEGAEGRCACRGKKGPFPPDREGMGHESTECGGMDHENMDRGGMEIAMEEEDRERKGEES